MIWLLVIVLVVIALAAVFGLVVLTRLTSHEARLMEYARIEAETRWAERQVHGIAREAFQAMLDEARSSR
jgi:uncharacterized protein YoxC